MNVNKPKNQPMLVSSKCVVGTLAAMLALVCTPVFSNTENTPKKAAADTQITHSISSKSRKTSGKAIYICSPAGFGKKSSCYKR